MRRTSVLVRKRLIHVFYFLYIIVYKEAQRIRFRRYEVIGTDNRDIDKLYGLLWPGTKSSWSRSDYEPYEAVRRKLRKLFPEGIEAISLDGLERGKFREWAQRQAQHISAADSEGWLHIPR